MTQKQAPLQPAKEENIPPIEEHIAEENIAISRTFSFWGLARFAMPVMLMELLYAAFHVLDDGLFISRFIGKNALAAVSILLPVTFFVVSLGVMIAAGVSAHCPIRMGEGDHKAARADFTSITIVSFFLGAFFCLLFFILKEPLLLLLGATDLLIEDCRVYGELFFTAMPIIICVHIFDHLYAAAGRPGMGLLTALLSGCTNIFFDYLFIVRMQIGVRGAAYATILGDLLIFFLGVAFYASHKGDMFFVRPTRKWAPLLLRVTKLGTAEFVGSASQSIMTYVANRIMLKQVGEDGVSAFAVMANIKYLLISAAFGYSAAVAPILSYNLGKGDNSELQRQIKHALIFLASFALLMLAACLLCAQPLVALYVPRGADPAYSALVLRGLYLASSCVLFAMPTIFITRMFLALAKPKASALLSLLRNLVFNLAAISLLSFFFGLTGVWLSIPVGELLGLITAVIILAKYRTILCA